MSRILHISQEEISKQSEKIFKPIKYGESGIGICYPGCKIQYNLSCFLENKSILKKHLGNQYKKFLFITINFEQFDNELTLIEKITNSLQLKKIKLPKENNLALICKTILNYGIDPYFFLLDAHVLAENELSNILQIIHSQILQFGRIGATIFFETSIDNKRIAKVLKEQNKFLQNITYFPTYSKEEAKKFVNNLALSWKIKINTKIVNLLVSNFGGSLWLLREGLRQFRENPIIKIEEILNSQGIELRLEKIYSLFSKEEKKILVATHCNTNKDINIKVKKHLLATGILVKENNRLKISIPALLPYIKKENLINQFVINNNKVFFNNKDLSGFFTNQELSILKLLISNKGDVVSRESIAQVMWKKEWEDRYSEWAIDKQISRLRLKLFAVSHNRTIIRTLKTKGVVFS